MDFDELKILLSSVDVATVTRGLVEVRASGLEKPCTEVPYSLLYFAALAGEEQSAEFQAGCGHTADWGVPAATGGTTRQVLQVRTG